MGPPITMDNYETFQSHKYKIEVLDHYNLLYCRLI